MACDPPLLVSNTPSAVAAANVHIGHIQLRDLVICPRERGVLNYIRDNAIVEHDLNTGDSPRTLVPLSFCANTLTSLNLDSNTTLLAAGGQDAEIHLSCHTTASSKSGRSKLVWHSEKQLLGSINNSILLTSLSLTRSNQSAVEPRVGISNNDCTVRLYEVPLRVQSQKRHLRTIGCLKLDVPINHSSISPDGRTLLSVGDSSKIYFHYMHGGDQVNFERIQTLILPPPDASPLLYPSSLAASFSTAFSADGMKFAVASQEGVLAIWDVRSSKPMKVIQTDKHRGISSDDGYLSDDPTDWTRGRSKAPGFSVRSVKFGGGGASGKEVLVFTEHTSLVHVLDARTFETEEILKVPTVRPPEQHDLLPTPASSPPRAQERSPPVNRHVFSSLTPAPRHAGRSHLASTPGNGGHGQRHIAQALSDAFRIPTSYSPPSSIGDSTWRTLRLSHVRNTSRDQDDFADIVVVPPLGDRSIESEVHALLNAQVSSSEDEDVNTGSTHGDFGYRPPNSRLDDLERHDDDMDVDELDSIECMSTHASRSSSPIPSTTEGYRRPSAKPRKVVPTSMRYRDDLDIAGTCFDPTGGYIYVASPESVVEWTVRDAEKTWWHDDGWR